MSAHRTFPRTDHILCHKSALYKYKKIDIIPSIFSDQDTMKLEVNHKKPLATPLIHEVKDTVVKIV